MEINYDCKQWSLTGQNVYTNSAQKPWILIYVLCLVASNSLRSHGLQPTRLLCPWGFSRQEYWSGLPCPPPGNLPKPGIELRSPALQADSLLSESPGKPKNTGVGGLSLLQGIFPIQEPNRVSCIADRSFNRWAIFLIIFIMHLDICFTLCLCHFPFFNFGLSIFLFVEF